MSSASRSSGGVPKVNGSPGVWFWVAAGSSASSEFVEEHQGDTTGDGTEETGDSGGVRMNRG